MDQRQMQRLAAHHVHWTIWSNICYTKVHMEIKVQRRRKALSMDRECISRWAHHKCKRHHGCRCVFNCRNEVNTLLSETWNSDDFFFLLTQAPGSMGPPFSPHHNSQAGNTHQGGKHRQFPFIIFSTYFPLIKHDWKCNFYFYRY